jgi:hypothetical protein
MKLMAEVMMAQEVVYAKVLLNIIYYLTYFLIYMTFR